MTRLADRAYGGDTSMLPRYFLIGFCTVFLAVGATARAGDEKPAPEPKVVEKLINDLSSEEFAVREAATRKLAELGDAVVPALEKAQKSPDRETSRRAEEILQTLRLRHEERELKKLLAELDKTPLDKLIAHIAKDPNRVTEAEWKALGKLIEAVVAQTNKVSGTTIKVPVDITALKTETNPPAVGDRKLRFVSSGFSQPYTHFEQSAIICSGDTNKWITGVENSVVIVDGDFEGATGIFNSVIICRGNFKKTAGIYDSLVLCGGDFVSVAGIENSVVQAASFGGCTVTRKTVFINLPEVKATLKEGDRYPTTKVDPLSLLRFTPKKKEK
jgi:hypothetical protein